jgi:hypothetical protein
VIEITQTGNKLIMGPLIYLFRRVSLFVIISSVLSAPSLYAQQIIFSDDFEYENIDEFLETSGWNGNLEHFTLVQDSGNTLLRLDNQSPDSNNLTQITTRSTIAYGEWEFYYWFESFAATDANRAFIFLMADIDDLSGNVNGYALRTGENGSDKRFRLVRLNNGSSSVIATSETQILQDRAYQIKVTRSETDGWRLYVSEGYGSTPMLDEGFSSMDNSHQSSSFFGIRLHYSSTRNQQFYFDDIIISRELEKLRVEDIDLINARRIDITFNQPLEKNTLNPAKFTVNHGIGSPESVTLAGEDYNVAELYFTSPFDDGEYHITINGVESEFGQEIDDNTEVFFSVQNPFGVISVDAVSSNQIYVEFTITPEVNDLVNEFFEIRETGKSDIINPQSIDYNADISINSVFLNFGSALPIGEYSLTINNLYSDQGWPLRDKSVFEFSVDNPFTVDTFTILSRIEIEISFSQDIQSGANISENYVLNGASVALNATLSSNNVVLLHLENPLEEGDYTLTVSNILSIKNWEIEPGTEINFSLLNQFSVESVAVEASNLLKVIFTEPPDENELDTDRFQINRIGYPNAISYDREMSPMAVYLEFEAPFFSGEYNLSVISVQSDFGWPLSGETEFDFIIENPFIVTDFLADGRTGFMIAFSQDVDTFDTADFQILGTGLPDSAVLAENDRIILTYENPVDLGNHQLVINNVISTDGWQIEPETTIGFSLFDEFEVGDLVISEFYYRVPVSWRTDEFQRPQYVEIFNRTNKLLNLRNFTINGNNISIDRDLPIEGGEYIVIARGTPVFEQRFGERNFVEADQFPQLSLTTSGSIIFETDVGLLIEELTFVAASWGGNEVSLERYSFDVPAGFRDNWAESADVLTGSPGLPNTVTTPADPPVALSASFPEPKTLLLTFSRTLSVESLQSLSNFSLNNNAEFHLVAVSGDERTVEFKTDEKLEDLFTYTFSYRDVGDIFGNMVSGTQQFQFIFENPFRILSAWLENETSLRVKFTLPINTSAVNLTDFQLSDGTLPVSLSIPNSETVELTFSSSFDTGAYEIVVNNIESFNPEISEQWELEPNSSAPFFKFDTYRQGDLVLNEFMYRPPAGYPRYVELQNISDRFLNLRDWELRRAEGASNNGGVISNVDLPIEPGGFVVFTPNAELIEEIFGPGPWVQMNNYPGLTQTTNDRIRLIDHEGGLVEIVDYNPSTWGGNGVALERRSVDTPVNEINNWGESEAERRGTPGEPNSIGPDQDGPRLLNTGFIDGETVLVTFSGSLDLNAIGTSNFSLNRGLSIIHVEFINSVTAKLTMNEAMTSGRAYTVTVTNIRDIFGNVLGQDTSAFTYYFVQEARPGDVVISEFMYNEPDGYTRYIELYNRSNRVFDLAGWQQANDTGTRRAITNERVFFTPGSYVVLLPNETLLDIFPGLPFINAGSGLSALKNGGDEIVITNAENVSIDSLRYSPGWGGKGVALERRDLNAYGSDPNNWGESQDPLFGTPGNPNSIGPPEDGPGLVSVDFIDGKNVIVTLSGALDHAAISRSNFSINRGRSVTAVSFISTAEAVITLDAEMSSGTVYTVTVTNIRDIFGKTLSSTQASFIYYRIEEAKPGEVVINEFMYNEPDDYTRYIELYNTGNKAFDLSGWQQANDTGTRRTITDTRTILPPDSYVVILPNLNLLSVFPDIPYINAGSSLSSLKNGGDSIVIFNRDGLVIDSLRYSPSWGGNGVALERRRTDLSSLFPENWAESPGEMFGTPGSTNQADTNFDLTATSVRAMNRRQLRVHFNSAIDESSVVTGNFTVGSANPADVSLVEVNQILLQFDSNLQTGHRTLMISNLQTPGGFRIAENAEFSFTVFDEFVYGDVVINEFMYQPPSGYARYVEIFNNSGKLLNLRDWRLQRRQTSTEPRRILSGEDLVLLPGDYLVLTDDAAVMTEIFGNRNYVELSNYPNFTVSTADQIRLFTDRDVLADSLEYIPSVWGGNGVALERRSPAVSAALPENWAESPNNLLGTPGMPNEAVPDTSPPRLLSAGQYEDQGFILRFDKKIDTVSSGNLSNYSVNPSIVLSKVVLNYDEVILFAGTGLVNGQIYEISVRGVADIFGNVTVPAIATVQYLKFGEAAPGKIVINEILYRRLQAGSPIFVEIYNQTNQNFNLSGWSLSNISGSIEIPYGTVIRENDYLVFTDTPAFSAESDKIIHLPGFRALNNTGDAVVLRNSMSEPIDSVYYEAAWYQNPAGISLERKDPSALSIDPSNWAQSIDNRGSTAAEQNSRFQLDESPPEIRFANIIREDTIAVTFNKFVNLAGSDSIKKNTGGRLKVANSSTSSTRFYVNGAEIPVLMYDPQQANRVVLDGSSVERGEELILLAENLRDFKDNFAPEITRAIAQPLTPGDLVINEIMFNPIADNRDGLPDQSQYIEIFNRRPYAISLEGIILHDEPDENGEINRIEAVSGSEKWISAGGYALFYPEPQNVPFKQSRTALFFDLTQEIGNFSLRVNRSTLSLPNGGRKVFLADSTLATIDMIEYSQNWHNPNLIDTRGIALERISPDFGSSDPSNWGSSANVRGGTPGSKNSIFQESRIQAAGTGVFLNPNPFSPDGNGFEDTLFINYLFDEPDYLLRIRIYDRYGRLVRNLAEGKNAGFEGTVLWDGRTDRGLKNRIGIYIILVEAYNSTNGRNLIFKETAVIARQF